MAERPAIAHAPTALALEHGLVDERAADVPAGPPPRLADGTELLGEYGGSGFKEPPSIVRRRDGQMLQLPRLLYLVLESIDGERDVRAIGDRIAELTGRRIDPADVEFLLDEKLRPLGVVAPRDGEPEPELETPDPMLALKMKKGVVPPAVVQKVALLFKPLFLPPVILAVLAGLVALDVWLFGVHGIAPSIHAAMYQPATLLLVLALVALSAAFHECGHAAATSYGGAKPGAMGVGLYIIWPAFYTDITDAYRLSRGGRLRADLGGVYFNVVFVLGTAAAYFLTGFEPLLLLIPLQHLEIAHQLLPFLRLDGFYIVSDLTGVPDMFSRIRPVLRSLLPWTERDPRVTALKRWARAVVTVYVLTVIPILLFMLALMAISTPRVVATAWDVGQIQWRELVSAFHRRHPLLLAMHAIQLAVVALPPVGMLIALKQLGTKSITGLWRGTEKRPRARNLLVAVASAAATAAFFIWWTGGDYRPIQADERGTIGAGIHAFAGPWHQTGILRDPGVADVAPPDVAPPDPSNAHPRVAPGTDTTQTSTTATTEDGGATTMTTTDSTSTTATTGTSTSTTPRAPTSGTGTATTSTTAGRTGTQWVGTVQQTSTTREPATTAPAPTTTTSPTATTATSTTTTTTTTTSTTPTSTTTTQTPTTTTP